jgi:hypothetical protein
LGTTRLAVAFGAGLIALLHLALAINPLVMGMIEVWPTSLSIDTAESEGFPEPWYLEVTDGYIVFAKAEVHLKNEDSDPPELFRLTVPVVSASRLEQWQASIEQGEPPDASQLRLLASFNAEQVAELWPDVVARIESSQPLDLPPVQMTLKGDTELAKHMVFKPYDIKDGTENLDWEQMRWLRFERHFHSPGRFLKNLVIGVVLLAVAFAAFKYHRSRPDDVAKNVLDWSAVPGIVDAAPDPGDIDLDL